VDCCRKLTSCISDAQLFGNGRKLGDIADRDIYEGQYRSIHVDSSNWHIDSIELIKRSTERSKWSMDEHSLKKTMRKRMVVLWNLELEPWRGLRLMVNYTGDILLD
jgi:hypothetical protein